MLHSFCVDQINTRASLALFFSLALINFATCDEHTSLAQRLCFESTVFYPATNTWNNLIFSSMLVALWGLLLLGGGSQADGATSLSNWNRHRCLQAPHRRRSNPVAVVRQEAFAWSLFMTGSPSGTEVRRRVSGFWSGRECHIRTNSGLKRCRWYGTYGDQHSLNLTDPRTPGWLFLFPFPPPSRRPQTGSATALLFL